jgi:peptidoglycan/xylan/chitin deacetylase (PgdA/CDA1 family)
MVVALWFLYGALLAAFAAFALSHYRSLTLRRLAALCLFPYLIAFAALTAMSEATRAQWLGPLASMFSLGTPLAAAWKPLLAAYALFGVFVAYFIPRYESIGLGDQQGTIRRVVFPFRAAALTFDDGPSPEWTPQVLAMLKKHQVKATFFMVGEAVEKYPELVRQVAAAGHSIGSHSYSHPPLPLLGRARLREEIERAEQAFVKVLGRKPDYFRPPWGFYNRIVLDELRKRNYLTVLWTQSTQDWRNPGVDFIVSQVARDPHLGDIILMHDGGNYPNSTDTSREQTVQALDQMIPALESKGFQFKNVDEMVAAWLS